MRRPAIALAAALALGAATVAAAPGDARYAHPGALVTAADGARLNIYCLGRGAPTVVFDSGWEDWAPVWAMVQPAVARFTTACAYDRAGAGFSGPGPMPRTSVRIADELHSVLHRAGAPGPYILVGHAFGSDNVRTFAERYMGEVAGVVLVEGDVIELEAADQRDADHKGEGGIIAQLRACRALIAAGKPLPATSLRHGVAGRTCAQQFFRGLPEGAWSPGLNAKLLDIANTKLAMHDAYASEMEQMPADEAWLLRHRAAYGSRPLRALTTGRHGVGFLSHEPPPSAAHRRYEEQARKAQARWVVRSANGKQMFVADSSEYVPFDRPDAVIAAIREVYDQSRPR